MSFLEDYQLGRVIGSGHFGDVYLAVHTESLIPVAVKVLSKSKLHGNSHSKMVNNLLLGEIRTMRFLRDLSTSSLKSPNRNVTQSIACYQDDHHFYFVMELVTGGNLLKFINK